MGTLLSRLGGSLTSEASAQVRRDAVRRGNLLQHVQDASVCDAEELQARGLWDALGRRLASELSSRGMAGWGANGTPSRM